MESGSRGDMVVWLQQHLNGADIAVPVTGIYGKKTIRGIKKFQSQRGLGADGVAGTQTWNRLLKVQAGAGALVGLPFTQARRRHLRRDLRAHRSRPTCR